MVLLVKSLPANAGDIREKWIGNIPWRRAWQPTPVSLPGEFRGQRTLEVRSPWGHRELYTTGYLSTSDDSFASLHPPQNYSAA